MAHPKPIQKLIGFFTKFPGVGPRQATRFAFSLLKEDDGAVEELADAIKSLKKEVGFCSQCFRSIVKSPPLEAGLPAQADKQNLCEICSDKKRDATLLMVVEKESDLENMEKAGSYRGMYHMLGGVILPLEPNSAKTIHLKELFARVHKLAKEGEAEVILATNPTTEGDTTALYIERILEPIKKQNPSFKISRLGRGLSLGSELEYADEITIKNALTNRK